MLTEEGSIGWKGSIVDASFVDAPQQRISRKEKEQINEGNLPINCSDKKIYSMFNNTKNNNNYSISTDISQITESKIVTSVYNQSFEGTLDKDMISKVNFDGLNAEATQLLKQPDYINLMKVAIDNSDAIIRGSKELPEELDTYLNELTK